MEHVTTFPQYRRYKNQKSYFCIPSLQEFEQLSLIGKKYTLVKHQVVQLPERNLLHDLLHDYERYAEVISEATYTEKVIWCSANLELLPY